MDGSGHSPEIPETLRVATDNLRPEEQDHKDADSVHGYIYSGASTVAAIAFSRRERGFYLRYSLQRERCGYCGGGRHTVGRPG
jgi:hypothetical protein